MKVAIDLKWRPAPPELMCDVQIGIDPAERIRAMSIGPTPARQCEGCPSHLQATIVTFSHMGVRQEKLGHVCMLTSPQLTQGSFDVGVKEASTHIAANHNKISPSYCPIKITGIEPVSKLDTAWRRLRGNNAQK